jgi:hypothetical protein
VDLAGRKAPPYTPELLSISNLFEYVGAARQPEEMVMGAQRASDGAVFLRVWQDLKFIDAKRSHPLLCVESKRR